MHSFRTIHILDLVRGIQYAKSFHPIVISICNIKNIFVRWNASNTQLTTRLLYSRKTRRFYLNPEVLCWLFCTPVLSESLSKETLTSNTQIANIVTQRSLDVMVILWKPVHYRAASGLLKFTIISSGSFGLALLLSLTVHKASLSSGSPHLSRRPHSPFLRGYSFQLELLSYLAAGSS